MLAQTVYVLGALVTLVCSVLLLRRYAQVRLRLLLWSGLCFAVLTVTNALVFINFVLVPEADYHTTRLSVSVIGMALLLYGLVWEGD